MHSAGAEYEDRKLACIQSYGMLNTRGYLSVFPSHNCQLKAATYQLKSHVLCFICEKLLDH